FFDCAAVGGQRADPDRGDAARHVRQDDRAHLFPVHRRAYRRACPPGAARHFAAVDRRQRRRVCGATAMKIGTIFLALLTLAATAARAEQQTRLYGPDGRTTGTAVPLGDGSVRYFDARLNSLATSTTTGNTTR